MKQVKHFINGTITVSDLSENDEDRIALEKEERKLNRRTDLLARIDALQATLNTFDTLTAAQRTSLLKSLLRMVIMLLLKIKDDDV